MSKDRTQKYLRTGFTIYTGRHDDSEKTQSKKWQLLKRPKGQNKLLSDPITVTGRMPRRRTIRFTLRHEEDSLLQMSHITRLKAWDVTAHSEPELAWRRLQLTNHWASPGLSLKNVQQLNVGAGGPSTQKAEMDSLTYRVSCQTARAATQRNPVLEEMPSNFPSCILEEFCLTCKKTEALWRGPRG